ncbi:MAG: DUF4238 domain-containing protein [Bdellovibrionaceae bacterium]|nr:DUF4238 domain-containing protein [Pseudobdellovibrionaceae bacterium]
MIRLGKTKFNHYISKVFLKSWLRPNDKKGKETLLCFLINEQRLRADVGRSVAFAGESFLYSFIAAGELDDSFESYLKDGEDAWGLFLSELVNGKVFQKIENLNLCLFMLVSFAYRTKINFKLYEKMFKISSPDLETVEIKNIALDMITEDIEYRTDELLRRKMLLIEYDSDLLFTCEKPLFDLKFSKFKRDEIFCAITPRHLLYISQEITNHPELAVSKTDNAKIATLWNSFVLEMSRDWVVATNCAENEEALKSNLTLDKVNARKQTDRVILNLDGEEHIVLLADIEDN